MESLVMVNEFWRDKQVLITGHTGFKGGWLTLWLQHMGAKVTGVSLDPPTKPNLYNEVNISHGIDSTFVDIRKLNKLKEVFQKCQPDIVFHLAAQSLVRYSYHNPVETYQTNVMGTLNVLEAIRENDSIRAAVLVTTDKCYENREWVWAYRENDPMGGYDPYSSSKGCAELLIASYRNSFFKNQKKPVGIASVRAGNVIGGGDWSQDRLIPDIIRAFGSSKTVEIRSPYATRPWQHVLEPLAGYMDLAQRLYDDSEKYSEAWNFGPNPSDIKTVEWIVKTLAEKWGDGANWEFTSCDSLHEANSLKLECSKSNSRLNWWPKWDLEIALDKIVEWHRKEIAGEDLRKVSIGQIEDYMQDAEQV